jgi:NAD(P)-dependent dehydrogenase (short-subunit alcohol dehydrogenase family)
MRKIALVTGASSGIGEATVRQLLNDGYKVYAAARRVEKMPPLAAAGATVLALDLTQDASIVAAIETIKATDSHLDVLVNNAGYGSYGALEDVPLDEARRQCEVNLFGLARLCQLALPMMRAQKSGKILNVTSIGGKLGTPFGNWYHATKFAVEGLSDCLRMEVKPFGIDVIVIEPGAIATEWVGIARDSLVARSGDTAYGPYARKYAAMFASPQLEKLASKPEVVAKTISRAIAARKPKTRYATGGGAHIFLALRRLLPDRLFDGLVWGMSQRGAG